MGRDNFPFGWRAPIGPYDRKEHGYPLYKNLKKNEVTGDISPPLNLEDDKWLVIRWVKHGLNPSPH